MTVSFYPVNHPLAVHLWSRKLFSETLKQTWASKFMGNDTNAMIHVKEDLSKSKGDMITLGLRMQLNGAGILGDGSLEGQEEAMTMFHMPIMIDQLRHAVRSAGEMTQQRVSFEIREEARLGLQDWWADRLDTCVFNQLCGYTLQTDLRFTGNQPVEAYGSESIIFPIGKKSEEELTEKDTFSLGLLDDAIGMAKILDPSIRPIRIQGEDKYVCFIHPLQANDLRQSKDWKDIQHAALSGGVVEKNPIYTGALGEYNNVIIHESSRITLGISSKNVALPNVRRAVLCGAQSIVMALGQANYEPGSQKTKMSWVEESFDYNNQLGVSAGMIFGLKRTRFNNKDFASILIPSVVKPIR